MPQPAITCAICNRPLPSGDRLPFGAGRAHAKCAMRLTHRLRAAHVAIIVGRHQRRGGTLEVG